MSVRDFAVFVCIDIIKNIFYEIEGYKKNNISLHSTFPSHFFSVRIKK